MHTTKKMTEIVKHDKKIRIKM